MSDFTIVIHGGAGTILKEDMTPELEKTYEEALQESLTLSYNSIDSSSPFFQNWIAKS